MDQSERSKCSNWHIELRQAKYGHIESVEVEQYHEKACNSFVSFIIYELLFDKLELHGLYLSPALKQKSRIRRIPSLQALDRQIESKFFSRSRGFRGDRASQNEVQCMQLRFLFLWEVHRMTISDH